MTYHDFEIRIDLLDGGRLWRLRARGEAGEGRVEIEPPVQQEAMASLKRDLDLALRGGVGPSIWQTPNHSLQRVHWPALPDSAEQLGQRLLDALLTGAVGKQFHVALGMARKAGKGLRLRLRFDPTVDSSLGWIASLPWELLRPHDKDFLALDSRLSIVRYLDVGEPPDPFPFKPPLRVLAVLSAPKELPALELETEMANLREALNNEVALVELRHPTHARLLEILAEQGPFHAFHFLGHGDFDERTGQSSILLETEGRNADPLSGHLLARLLQRVHAPRLVVLNACETGRSSEVATCDNLAAALVSAGLPAVVAMQFPITDHAAVQFSQTFYRQLSRRATLDAAVAEARQRIALPGSLEWAAPTVFMRLRNGDLWGDESVEETPVREDLQEVKVRQARSRTMGFYAVDDLAGTDTMGFGSSYQKVAVDDARADGEMVFAARRRKGPAD